jgi:hypothetical protein
MEKVKPILDKLKAIEVPQLERQGQDFNFSDIFPLLVKIFDQINLINDNQAFWDEIPTKQRNDLENNLENFLIRAENIARFNPTLMNNPQHLRDSLANDIKNFYSYFYESFFPKVKLYTIQEALSSKKLDESLKQANEAATSLQAQKEQGDEILKALRETSAVTGVSKFAIVFKEQASHHKHAAKNWIIASSAAALGISLFLWWIFNQLIGAIKNDGDLQASLQVFIAKIILLSFFSVIFYQLIKNYNANMHLYTLNKHRENSLTSFQAFVESTEDPKIKDAVLIQATKAIFEAGETGYVSSRNNRIPSIETIKIIDQIKEK